MSGGFVSVANLADRVARPGRVAWIGLRPARRAPVVSVTEADAVATGLVGDRHARDNRRAVTLFQAEHLSAVAGFLGRADVDPADLRRNLVVAGINLAAFKGQRLAVGAAILEIAAACPPCSRMEETFGHGGYAALRGHGGWCARVCAPGRIAVGDTVRVAPDAAGGS